MLQASMHGQAPGFGRFGHFGAAKRDPGVQQLQAALKQLGERVRDGALMKLAVDGLIGPGTVSATNRAFTTHIGAGQAPAQYRSGRLPIGQVQAWAPTLAQLVTRETARRATAAVTTGAGRFGPPLTAAQQAEIAARPTARTGAGHFGPSVGPPLPPAAAARELQLALQQLGTQARDSVLMKLAVDGKIGSGTVSAVNRAFTAHIGPGQAPAQYRTGKLTSAMVTTMAPTFTQYIRTEAARRATAAVTGPGRFGPALTAAQRAEIQASPTARTGAAHFGPPLPPAQAARELQQALVYLAQQSRDRTIAVGVDGKIGPATAKAVNRALTVHVGPYQAPANLRTGSLTPAAIVANATQIGGIIRTEAARRATAAATGAGRFGPGVATAPSVLPSAGSLATREQVRVLQTRLGQLGRVKRDSALMAIKADGLVGPATASAVNRAFTAHVTSAPGAYRTGALTSRQVSVNANALSMYIGQALQDVGTTPAAAPPGTEIGPNAEADTATNMMPEAPPPSPPPGAEAYAPGGGEEAMAPPPPPPSYTPPAYMPPSGGGGDMAPAPGGEGSGVTTADLFPSGGKIPWVPIGIGLGVAAVAVTAVVLINKNKSASSTSYRQPARRRAA